MSNASRLQRRCAPQVYLLQYRNSVVSAETEIRATHELQCGIIETLETKMKISPIQCVNRLCNFRESQLSGVAKMDLDEL